MSNHFREPRVVDRFSISSASDPPNRSRARKEKRTRTKWKRKKGPKPGTDSGIFSGRPARARAHSFSACQLAHARGASPALALARGNCSEREPVVFVGKKKKRKKRKKRKKKTESTGGAPRRSNSLVTRARSRSRTYRIT
jgi:hypothetical protein